MKVLVTGGAGYIGSFMTRTLLDKGFEVVVFDSLERGHKDAVDARAILVQGDITKSGDLDKLFEEYRFDAIMHFAGLISVEESTREPERYFKVNTDGAKNLFEKAQAFGTKRFIFSSTAAVYGNPQEVPIPEDHPKNPTSPYGESKLKTEQVLMDLREKDPSIGFACLRYFNACGASLDGNLGERHEPETHIIPLAIRAALEGRDFYLFGTDYDTEDGTCVRDYIHVLDLVEAHLLALGKIEKEPSGYFYNVGTGSGFSNKQVVGEVERVSGKKVNVVEKERRPGDADKLIAGVERIKSDLSFSPKYSDLSTIVESAYKWHNK